ncbi:HD domain-containing protein [Niabella insulamsoli]|uniref:HD domain-containing protein n=1 Tax=Niabella insulamsoli TaxID=3144874 RepID=UPI0031FCEC2B
MTATAILSLVKKYIVEHFSNETTGHDYFHIERVVKMAKWIAEGEPCDLFTVELAAWLHDVGDHKLNNGTDRSATLIRSLLIPTDMQASAIENVIEIVSQISFSKGKTAQSIEAKIVQDADRLDAIGAIGIARVFAFGGSQHQPIYDPDGAPSSIQHFYDKLLKLKALMHTKRGRQIAAARHQYLETFLNRFHSEWNSELITQP